MRALLVLPLLAGCSSLFAGNDGTYLMTLELQNDSCDEENPAVGTQQEMLASLYRTGPGNLALDLGGGILTGASPQGQDFELSYESGTDVSYDGCDRLLESSEVVLSGTFTADLGFEGTAKSTERVVQESCPDDEEESCTLTYSVTALKLSPANDRRPTGSIAWGYFSGGGY